MQFRLWADNTLSVRLNTMTCELLRLENTSGDLCNYTDVWRVAGTVPGIVFRGWKVSFILWPSLTKRRHQLNRRLR